MEEVTSDVDKCSIDEAEPKPSPSEDENKPKNEEICEEEQSLEAKSDGSAAVKTEKERRGSVKHTVKDRETLVSIAAMYDITPSELAQTNKMGMSRMVFPGQILDIPPEPEPSPALQAKKETQMEIIEYQFVKLFVRHITTGKGVVSGSIFLTPNSLIFDPDPTDPLVEELGTEAFQVITPMEYVVNAAIFLDFFPIGNTSKVSGREYPAAEIFTVKPSKRTNPNRQGEKRQEENKSNEGKDARQQPVEVQEGEDSSTGPVKASGSSYSLSRETTANQEHTQDTADSETPEELRQEPYYLRLTMGHPVGRPINKSTPTLSYGYQTLVPEYWFIVPSYRVLSLYNFFQSWFPEIYTPFDLEEIHEMGFELVPEPDLETIDNTTSVNTSVRNSLQKTLTMTSIDMDGLIPDMETQSKLISEDQRRLLYRHFPPRIQGNKWSLAFSTESDGFSLHTLYRKVADIDCPVLLIIQDTNHAVFGGLLSCPPTLSETFTGTGESWLFTFFPTFKVYRWTGENNYIVRGDNSFLVIGSSDGQFGLWLDESFECGRSQPVNTFKNKPLPGNEDFTINNVECWCFN